MNYGVTINRENIMANRNSNCLQKILFCIIRNVSPMNPITIKMIYIISVSLSK